MNSINNKNWTVFENRNNGDTKWDIIFKNVVNILDDQIPIKTVILPKSKPEWLVGELVEYTKDRDVLLCIVRRTKSSDDRKAANRARNKVNKLVKNANNNFIKGKFGNY